MASAAHESHTPPRHVLPTETRLRAHLSNAPAVIFALDPDGTVALYEGKGLGAYGLLAENFVGHSIFEVAADIPVVLRDARRALSGEALSSIVLIGVQTFDVRWEPLVSEVGAVMCVTGVAMDITERVAALRQQAAEADQSALYGELLRRLDSLEQLVSRLVSSQEHTRRQMAAQAHGKQLTDREQQILRLVAEGWSNREIGGELALAAGTVKNHVARILSKLDVTDRTQAAVRALDLGLIQRRP